MNENGLLLNLKVLYVEDDDDTREMTQLFLKKRVGKLIMAKDGKEALEKFENNRPDLVITDLRMPNMGGIELSRNIRNIDKNCPIIITTAFSEVEVVIEAVDIGIEKYIVKPIDTKELLAAMNSSALKKYEKAGDNLLIGSRRIEDLNEKKSIEQLIQNKIALFIKSNTGKGPKYVKAFIRGNILEIEAKEAMTLFEKSLLKNRKNEHLLGYAREAFYNDRKVEMCDIIEEIIGSKCYLKEVTIDFRVLSDKLLFRID